MNAEPCKGCIDWPHCWANQTCAKEALSPAPCSVSSTRREVIENKLLTALDDEGKVAILASEADLNMLIESLGLAVRMGKSGSVVMQRDLMQLRDAAFPKGTESRPDDLPIAARYNHDDGTFDPQPSEIHPFISEGDTP